MKKEQPAYDEIFERMNKEIEQASEVAPDSRAGVMQNITIIQKYLVDMKAFILDAGFSSVTEEIDFFKRIKPRFYSHLIYYHKLLQIELGRPSAGKKAERKYLNREVAKLENFFRKYVYLYRYCRSGADFLDTRFFTRGNAELIPGVESYGVDTDPLFTTGYDFIVAKMQANELLQQYLEQEIHHLQVAQQVTPHSDKLQRISWTASKASLIELVYALQSTGVFNNGKAALSEIAFFLENMFQIKLGNYYRVFQEIRIRKKNRTQFLDEMKDRLIQKMDYTDENPHGQ